MNAETNSALKVLLKYPLITARQLAQESGASVDDLRALFRTLQSDSHMQQELKSWGPAQGYGMNVLHSILESPQNIQRIHRNDPAYPKILELHLGPTCPCACIFCYSKGETVRSSACAHYRPGPNNRLLSTAEVLSIVNMLKEKGCESVYFSGGLEPFTNKTTIQVLHALPEDLQVHIFTNGVPNLLDDDVLKFLVRRVNQLRFSIHAATPGTYRQVQMPHRPDGEIVFRRVIGRVKQAVMFRNELRATDQSAADISVTFLVVPANYAELKRAVRMWSKIGIDRFEIGNDVLRAKSHTAPLTETQRKKLARIFRQIELASGLDKANGMTIRPSRVSVQSSLARAGTCYAPLEKAVIDPYGNLWACCMRAHPFLQKGNFHLGIVRSGDDFQKLVERWNLQPAIMRPIPLGFHCQECTEYEYAANICIQKLVDDLDFGIPLADQPFKV